MSLERHRRLWPVALLPRDAGSLLSLSVVHEDLRGHRLVARQLDGAGALLTRLGSIGPRLDRFSRLQDMVVGAAAEEGSGVAVTYGRGVHAHELETLDLFLFGPDLQPRGGRRHRLAEGSVGAVSRPAWTDRGEVLVAWHDRSPDRLVLGVVAAFD